MNTTTALFSTVTRSSHFAGLAANTIRGHRTYLNNLKAFFGNRTLDKITVEMVEAYRDQRRRQPAKRKPNQTVKGATVNRELECLKCVLDLAFKRKYIPENPASTVKHFNELRERPVRRMLALDEERRILEVAPPIFGLQSSFSLRRVGGRIARASHFVGTKWISTANSSAWTMR